MSIAPVVIEFLAKGTPQIQQSFRGVQDAAARAERETTKAAERAERQRVAGAQREARAKIQVLKQQEREIDRAARETVKIHSAAEREVEKIQERAHRTTLRLLANETRERERAAAQWVKMREREEKASQKNRERFATGIVGGAARGVVTGLQRSGNIAMGLATTAAQLGGGFSIADSVAQRAELDRGAALLANNAIGVAGPGGKIRTAKDVDPKAIVARARAASATSGVDASDLLSATQSYVDKSSDFEGGMANMEFFGDLAKGTGAKLSDIGDAAGIIRSQNKDLDAEGMKNMLLAVVQQGKQGSVTMPDLAHAAGKMTRTATSFAGDQSVNQQKLLGLSQIAVRTAGSPEGAAVALSSLASDTRGHAAGVSSALGYSVLDAGGKVTKSPEQLIADIMGATGGNLAKLGQHGGLGFTKPTMKIFEALKPDFDKAQAEYLQAHPGDMKSANKAGAAASLKEMTTITGQTMSRGDLTQMADRVRDSSPEKFEAAMRQLKMAVGDELLPVFVNQLLPAIKDATPAFVELLRTGVPAIAQLVTQFADFVKANKGIIDSMAAHPVGTLVAYEVTKSFAAAALPELLKKLMAMAFGGGSTVPKLPVPVPGGGGGGAAWGFGVGGAALATSALVVAGSLKMAKGYTDGQMRGDLLAEKIKYWQQGDHENGISPEAAAAEVAAAKGVSRPGIKGGLDRVANFVLSPFDDESSKEYDKQQGARGLIDSKALQEAIASAAAAGVREGVRNGMSNSGPQGAGRSEPIINR